MEVLVVILIIGVIVSVATLSMGVLGRDSQAEEQARRLWTVLKQAREEAELQGLDGGMFVSAQGYEFLRYDGRNLQWVPIEGDKLFATRELPPGLRLRLWLESREIVLKPEVVDREDKDSQKKWPPQIIVLSSGEVMPFELQIEREGTEALWRVVVLPDNDLRLEQRIRNEPWQLVAQTKPPEDEDAKRAFGAR